MSYIASLEIAANWAAILTAALAAYAYGRYRLDKCKRVQKLEKHLREEKLRFADEGKRTVLHLIANLSMTEAEILSAAFESKFIRSSVAVDENGRADILFFEYDGADGQRRPPY